MKAQITKYITKKKTKEKLKIAVNIGNYDTNLF